MKLVLNSMTYLKNILGRLILGSKESRGGIWRENAAMEGDGGPKPCPGPIPRLDIGLKITHMNKRIRNNSNDLKWRKATSNCTETVTVTKSHFL